VLPRCSFSNYFNTEILKLFSKIEPIIVLDFKTTRRYPDNGDRIIEIGAVLLRNQKIVNRFQDCGV